MTGASALAPAMRARLLAEQLHAIVQLIPAMCLGAALIALLLLAATIHAAVQLSVALWAAAAMAMLGIGLRAWLKLRRRPQRRTAGPRAMRRAVANAVLNGCLWGVLPMLLLPAGPDTVRLLGAITVAAVLCAAGPMLAVLPAAAIGFAVPVMIGTALAITRVNDPGIVYGLGLLLFCYAAVMPVIGLRIARGFVRLVSEARMRRQNDIIGLLLKEFEANSSDWLWEFDREGRLLRVSERFAAAAAVAADKLAGQDFCAFLREASEENEPIIAEIELEIGRRNTFRDVVVTVTRGGEERWWRITGKPNLDKQGRYTGYIGAACDITAERLAERRINFLAHNDALTGLLNRAKFTENLRQCVARLERYGSPFTLLFLDLDQFKSVNDSRGHLIGDKLLAQVGERIRQSTREVDIVARLGGDEFAIILTRPCEPEEVAIVAQRMLDIVGQPYKFDEEVVSVGVSIGIAMAPLNGTRPDQILRNADLALYRAKAAGRGMYTFFESHMDADLREKRVLELELRQALEDKELVLYYQPLISTEDDMAAGFEALVRWNHPIRGLVPPAEFIPIAEQTGLIKQVGDWTIHEACRAAAAWPVPLTVAVNLSAKHFQMSDIAEVVRSALAASGLTPSRLELEITESLLIERVDEVIAKLMEIKALGVSIAMDDFGTGYSSLSYLLRFPFDKIKIDKSFVTASSDDQVARDILRSIASLGKTLKIRITAEGVETREQVEFLREIACTQLQGYYFARPLDETALAGYFLNQFCSGLRARGDLGPQPIQLSAAAN